MPQEKANRIYQMDESITATQVTLNSWSIPTRYHGADEPQYGH